MPYSTIQSWTTPTTQYSLTRQYLLNEAAKAVTGELVGCLTGYKVEVVASLAKKDLTPDMTR